ncbi:MAG: hypothetical protein ABI402_05990 [Ferruginibacter sp.]
MAKIIEHKALKILEVKKKALVQELNRLNNAIAALRGDNSYDDIAWTLRALDCIKANDRPMQTLGILECMFYRTPEVLQDQEKKRNYVVGLSVALNKMCSKGNLSKCAFVGVKGYFYGLPEWSNGNTFTEKYMNKLEQVKSKIA